MKLIMEPKKSPSWKGRYIFPNLHQSLGSSPSFPGCIWNDTDDTDDIRTPTCGFIWHCLVRAVSPPWKIIVVPNWSYMKLLTVTQVTKFPPKRGVLPLCFHSEIYREHINDLTFSGQHLLKLHPRAKNLTGVIKSDPCWGNRSIHVVILCVIIHCLGWSCYRADSLQISEQNLCLSHGDLRCFIGVKVGKFVFHRFRAPKEFRTDAKMYKVGILFGPGRRERTFEFQVGGFKYLFFSPLPGALIVKLRGLNFGGCRWKLSHILLYLFAGWVPLPGSGQSLCQIDGGTMSKVSKMRGIGLASLENWLWIMENCMYIYTYI